MKIGFEVELIMIVVYEGFVEFVFGFVVIEFLVGDWGDDGEIDFVFWLVKVGIVSFGIGG